MRIRTRFIKLSGILLMAIATLVTGLAFFLPYLLDVNAYRAEILAALQQSLNRQVSFKSGVFAWHFGPSFVFNNFSVKEIDGSADFLSAEQITVQLALIPLLEKKVELKNIDLNGATLSLIHKADGTFNIDDLLKPGKGSVQVQFKRVTMKKSTIKWQDQALQKDGLSASLINVQLTMDHLARGRKGHLKLSADLPALNGPSSRILFSGTVRLPELASSLLDTELNCDIDIKRAETGRFWPYYGRFIPFGNPGGRVDFLTSFKGKPRQFTAKGKIRINGATVNWPSIFHAALSPRSLQLDYSMKLTEKLIDISALEAAIDGVFRIKGNVRIHDYTSGDPRIVANASTPKTFKYEDIRNYVPYGIIEKDASDYVENKIKSGVFKLDTGLLDGRVSQIAHMEVGQNYNTLTIRGPVENAVLSYGPKAPTFNNIKGTIELKGKNFNLIGMSALFGTSPLKLDGSITEYNTDQPSDYPVKMDISPRGPEIAWLAGLVGASKLEYSNSSSLKLTGSGHHSAYRLSGEWDLRQAIYSFPGVVRKPSGSANQLAFSTIIGKEETRLSSLSYNLTPLILSGTALLRYGNQPYLGFDLQTNPFQMSETLPILSMWQQYQPRGKVQAHIKGNGNPEDFGAMEYNGTIVLNAFSAQPGDKMKPVSGINGTITFRGNSLETSSISAHYGSSAVTMKGRIKSLNSPEAEISLSSPEFFLRDLDLAPKHPDASIRRLNAAFSVRNGSYTFKSVSGLSNSSNFNISGVYLSGRTPEATLNVASTKLDIDDLLIFAPVDNTTGRNDKPGTDYKIKLQIDDGNYRKLQFSKLNVTAQKESGTVYISDITARVFGGKVSAKGRVARMGSQGNRYDLTIDLNKVNADKLLTSLDVSKDVTGDLTLHGDLTVMGNNLADIKRSALGNIRLQMNDGKLRKFGTLSKVFSILNVSQLLKFQLPDMVSGGMPYNNITGSIAVKDGNVSSQDLFISSDAINISIIGSTDIVREEMNFTLGVQPLQTVDKVVNRIPIFGWLLTGKDKSFLTAYFEAKGKWSDPQVNAIPVKSMGKGVLNIFRRVFELPVKLFTDTGEVILGQ
ncbi:MAG: AsmA-like C-terminal domain-containing protein [Steroidobacteraceae bacterium]|nr:AsmA-like C-terminal domain-containing protein [Deltaproteobacteria bacterium]